MAVYGMLARVLTSSTAPQKLYEAAAITIVSAIKVANTTAANATVKIHVLDTVETDPVDANISHVEVVPAGTTVDVKGIVLNAGQKVFVTCDQDNVVVTLFGYTRTV